MSLKKPYITDVKKQYAVPVYDLDNIESIYNNDIEPDDVFVRIDIKVTRWNLVHSRCGKNYDCLQFRWQAITFDGKFLRSV